MVGTRQRIGTQAGSLARAWVALSLVIGVVLAAGSVAHATPAEPVQAQEVVEFSVSDGTSYEWYIFRDCPDPDEPGCRVRRVRGSITFRITINISLCCRDITVRYGTVDGSAHAPDDYRAGSGTRVFPPGVFSATVTIAINDVGLDQPTERFTLRLSNANVPADVTDAGVGTIRDGSEEL
jgi:hypothetical protein